MTVCVCVWVLAQLDTWLLARLCEPLKSGVTVGGLQVQIQLERFRVLAEFSSLSPNVEVTVSVSSY